MKDASSIYLTEKFLFKTNLVHLSDQVVDEVIAISVITSFDVVNRLLSHTTVRAAQLKWP